MRVSPAASNQVQESGSTKQTAHARKSGRIVEGESAEHAAAAATREASKPEISGKAREAGRAREVALSAPDVREAKIAELKQRIAAGSYEVDPKAVADRMVDEHLETSGLG